MHAQLLLFLAFSCTSQVEPEDESSVEASLQARDKQEARMSLGGEKVKVLISRPVPPPVIGEDGVPRPVPAGAPMIGAMRMEPESFDWCLFGEKASRDATQKAMNDSLQAKINAATVEYELNDSERTRLELAGRGDIKRFSDQVELEREMFEKANTDLSKGVAAIHKLKPLRIKYRTGLFNEGSLYSKTLRKIRNEKQISINKRDKRTNRSSAAQTV